MRFDSTNFTSNRDRVRLLLWASQNDLNPKRGEIKVFKAIALTDAVPLNTFDMNKYGRKAGTSSEAVVGRYVMRVRIRDDLYTTNPHQYLPNPCKLSSAANIATAIKIIKMHTLCITAADYQHDTQDSIRKDDIVEITLNMNRETNTLDTNHGLVTKLIERKNERTDTSAFCPDLRGAFNINTIALLSSFAPGPDNAPVGGGKVVGGKCKTASDPSQIDFSKVKAEQPTGKQIAEFGNNNWRYQQPTLGNLKWLIENQGVKRVIRLNGDTANDLKYSLDPQTGGCIGDAVEKAFVESLGAEYDKMSAHSGFKKGKGYTKSIAETSAWFDKGGTLVHCTHGADRTGFTVAAWIKNGGYRYNDSPFKGSAPSNEQLWEYAIGYNSWNSYIVKKGTNLGYAKYLDGFYPMTEFCKKHPDAAACKNSDCDFCK